MVPESAISDLASLYSPALDCLSGFVRFYSEWPSKYGRRFSTQSRLCTQCAETRMRCSSTVHFAGRAGRYKESSVEAG